jgi:DNA topoisomerase-1
MDLRGDVPARELVLAGAFRMLDRGSLRVGSERYTNENGSHGLATLLCAHVLDHFSAGGGETIDPRRTDSAESELRALLYREGDVVSINKES